MTTRTRKKIDPFATDETETIEIKENETVTENNDVETVQGDQNYVTVILKGGGGYGAPSVSIRGASVSDALRHMQDHEAELGKLIQTAAKYGKAFGDLVDGDKPAASGGNSGGARPARQEAPSGQSRDCKHGSMTYRSGSKNGRTWEAFFCPTPQGTSDQCKPIFL